MFFKPSKPNTHLYAVQVSSPKQKICATLFLYLNNHISRLYSQPSFCPFSLKTNAYYDAIVCSSRKKHCSSSSGSNITENDKVCRGVLSLRAADTAAEKSIAAAAAAVRPPDKPNSKRKMIQMSV
jgi:hypothetical protein